MKRYEVMIELFMEALILCLQVVFFLYLIPKTLGYMWPFVAGWIIALITWPITQHLYKKFNINKRFVSIITLVLLIALIAGLLFLILVSLGKEAIAFMSDMPVLFEKFITVTEGIPDQLIQSSLLPDEIKINVDTLMESVKTAAFSVVNKIGSIGMSHAGSFAKNITNFFIGFIVTLLSAYFFVMYKEKLSNGYRKYFTKSLQTRIDNIALLVKDAIGGYLIAQLKLMGIIFAILLVGLLISGNSYAMILAFLIALLDIIPFFGTGFVLLPWAAFDLIAGNYSLVILRVILYLCCLLGRQLLQPKIIGDSVGLDPFITLVLIYVGFKVNGILGFIFAMIAGILVRNFYRMGLFDQKINRIRHLIEQFNKANTTI